MLGIASESRQGSTKYYPWLCSFKNGYRADRSIVGE